jgi:hypothetical protein
MLCISQHTSLHKDGRKERTKVLFFYLSIYKVATLKIKTKLLWHNNFYWQHYSYVLVFFMWCDCCSQSLTFFYSFSFSYSIIAKKDTSKRCVFFCWHLIFRMLWLSSVGVSHPPISIKWVWYTHQNEKMGGIHPI